MSSIQEALGQRFGKEKIRLFPGQERIGTEKYPVEILEIKLQLRSQITLLMTSGLSAYRMPVSTKYEGREHNELLFCLPSYWDLDDPNNEQCAWVVDWIKRLANFVLEKETWFGAGHTIPCGNPNVALSSTMKQNYFFLIDPIFLEKELQPLELDGKTVHFLAIVPIFPDEFDYKMGKGTYKLLKKMEIHQVTELLDDYRSSVLKRHWKFFGK